MEANTWVAFGALMFTVLTVSAGSLWALTNRLDTVKKEFFKELTEAKTEGDHQFRALHSEVELIERRASEPTLALREKVVQVELYIRDHCVSKREYEKDYAQLLVALKALQESIEKRLDAYEARVEKAINSVNSTGRLPLA